jgi:hypothetical protein
MHRCLPSLEPAPGGPPPPTTGATSTMREHETTDLFGSLGPRMTGSRP